MSRTFDGQLSIFPLCLFCLIMTGCGTILGKQQILSVDSIPRGLATYKEEHGVFTRVGQTPFFLKADAAPQQTFIFQSKLSGTLSRFTSECKWRWEEALFPDLAIVGFGLVSGTPSVWISGIGFLTVDYLRDTIYDCGRHFKYRLNGAKFTEPECRTFLLLPPDIDNPLLSQNIKETWRNLQEMRLSSCDSIISERRAFDIFARFNISGTTQPPIDQLTSKQILKIGYHSGASHLVQLKVLEHPSKIDVSAQALDLHSQAIDPAFEMQFAVEKIHQRERDGLLKFVGRYFEIFPNAFTYSFHFASQDTSEDYEVLTMKERNLLPKYLTGFGINSIQHPMGYAAWQPQFTIFPSLELHYQDKELKAKKVCIEDDPTCSDETEDHSFHYFFVNPLLHMGATLHSPAGAFYAGIQWGPIFGSIKEKNRQSQHGFSGVFGGSFGWYGFVEETTYVFVKLSTIKLPPNLSLRNPVIHEDHRNTLTYGTVGLGYFVPEFRSWMSRKVISLF